MTMISANPPVAELRALIDTHGVLRVARALFRALFTRRKTVLVPDSLRTDVGLPSAEREMRRYWEIR